MTAYQENISAIIIAGSMMSEIFLTHLSFAARDKIIKTIAHWAMKASSAIVAIDLPKKTLENQVSNKTIRWTSALGIKDLKAQTKT